MAKVKLRPKFRSAYRGLTNKQAAQIARYLERLAKTQELTVDVLLEDARSPESPLHALLEWDDSIAAEKYRRRQVHRIASCIHVVYEDTPAAKPVRAFLRVVNEENRSVYRDAITVMSNRNTRRQVIERAQREAAAAAQRYASIREVAAIFRSASDEISQIE